jgi:hypothetical protein
MKALKISNDTLKTIKLAEISLKKLGYTKM